MVKVVEAMPMQQFDVVIDAGAELFDELRRILRDHGLSVDDAPAVISIAAAGVMSVCPVSSRSFEEVIALSAGMWRQTGDDLDSLEFDPPHRQADAVVVNGANN